MTFGLQDMRRTGYVILFSSTDSCDCLEFPVAVSFGTFEAGSFTLVLLCDPMISDFFNSLPSFDLCASTATLRSDDFPGGERLILRF